jgi:BirA family biotin operon repressor/biotin-[acetyl-CoA-carboxylase] ligase
LHPDIRIKWPNDLWLNERKLAGILVETCAVDNQRYVVIGIGINITQPISEQTELRTPAAWLQELVPNITAHATVKRVALPLIQNILLFAEHGFEYFQNRFDALDLLKNRQIILHNHQTDTPNYEPSTGMALGVNNLGELTVKTSKGLITVHSSEVSIRPATTT